MARILLVEDDPIITSSLSELLAGEGHEVRSCATQDEAIAMALGEPTASPAMRGRAAAGPVDLVLLDVSLAQGNGFAVCGAVKRERPELPVIFLTASGDEFNTVTGLGMGADDYVAKPFRPRELVARIVAALRRARPGRRLVRLGPLAIDPDRARVTRDGAEVPLSALEYRLLLLLATNAGRLVTRDMIRDALWDEGGAYVEENTLSVYMKRLRDKVEDDPSHPRLIVTVRGLGYKVCG